MSRDQISTKIKMAQKQPAELSVYSAETKPAEIDAVLELPHVWKRAKNKSRCCQPGRGTLIISQRDYLTALQSVQCHFHRRIIRHINKYTTDCFLTAGYIEEVEVGCG